MKNLINYLLIFCITSTLFSCNERIDAANIGLLVDQYGSDKGQPVKIASGRVWYNPWTEDVIEIPANIQHKEFAEFVVNAKDGSEFRLRPQLNYRINKGKIVETFLKYRKDLPELEEGIIKTVVKESYRIVINDFTTDTIMFSRAKIEKMAIDTLKFRLEKEGFDVEQLTSGLYPPKSISDAIDAKNRAEFTAC